MVSFQKVACKDTLQGQIGVILLNQISRNTRQSLVYIQVAVTVLSARDVMPAEAPSAEQQVEIKAYAAQARSQIVRVFAHCTKDQQACLVMLPHKDSMVTLVEGKLTHIQLRVSALEFCLMYISEYGIN